MSSDSDFDFKKQFRQMIVEVLAREALSGGSWKAALAQLPGLLDINQADLEREIATQIELRSWDKKPKGAEEEEEAAAEAPIDLNAQRLQRLDRDKNKEGSASKTNSTISSFAGQSALGKQSEGGSYGSGVRQQVFEVVVRQGMKGAPWRSICAGPMKVNNIHPDEIQAEIDRRKAMAGDDPKKKSADDDDPPQSGRGGGGRPKAPVPRNPFPFLGGAARALPLPGKKKGKDAIALDIKSHDLHSHDESSSGHAESQDDDSDDE